MLYIMLTFLGAFSLVNTTPGQRNICFGWKITTLILLKKKKKEFPPSI